MMKMLLNGFNCRVLSALVCCLAASALSGAERIPETQSNERIAEFTPSTRRPLLLNG